jgi:hypothetical protein
LRRAHRVRGRRGAGTTLPQAAPSVQSARPAAQPDDCHRHADGGDRDEERDSDPGEDATFHDEKQAPHREPADGEPGVEEKTRCLECRQPVPPRHRAPTGTRAPHLQEP